MTRKLNDADRAAVDLVFERILSAANGSSSNGNGHSKGNGGAGAGESVVVMTASVSDQRLGAVQQILHVLETMPAPEPPADLASRTLQRIARGDGAGAGAMTPASTPAPPHFIDPNQPMA